jgi:hypothetical protein
MEQQEKNLQSLFRKLGEKKEPEEIAADPLLKNEVFTTIDATSLIADVLDLFTAKFLDAQAEIINVIPGSNYGNDKQNLLRYFEKKYQSAKTTDFNDEG